MIEALEQIVASYPGAKILRITTRTLPKTLKKNRVTGEPLPYEYVVRIAQRLVVLACQYGSCVNRQRNREDMTPDFQPEQLWKGKGRHVPGHPFLVEHTETGEQYVAVMHLRVTAQDLWTDQDGNAIDPASIADWLPKPSDNKKQGTEKPVYWRTVKVENVVGALYAGDEYPTDIPLVAMAEGA